MTSLSIPESIPKRLLKGKQFNGCYKEKRFCKDLGTYKDIIEVKAGDEPNLALDLKLFLDLLTTNTKWIGLTTTPGNDYLIWTDLEDDKLPFGEYPFDIRTVRSSDTELQLKLRVQDGNKSMSRNMSSGGQEFDLSKVEWSNYTPKKIANSFIGALMSVQWNWAALKQGVEFILVTLVYLVSELPNLIRFVGEFTLRAFRELSNLIHVLTPICMAIIDAFSKIFGVFFMLICDVMRTNKGRRRGAGQQHEAIGHHQGQPQQLTYR